jgi:hypothetical protein
METLGLWFFRFLTLVFAVGVIGCLMTIPLAAYKFFSVLFEKDSDQPEIHQEYDSAPPSAAKP